MFKKKLPVLTATICVEMESVRQTVEVLTGQRVRIRQMDFNTGRGMLYVGEQTENISFFFGRPDLLNFSFWDESGEPKEWYTALFDTSGEVRVIKDVGPLRRGNHIMWLVGKSFTERHEEPLYKERVMHCAAIRGLSLDEYLNTNE